MARVVMQVLRELNHSPSAEFFVAATGSVQAQLFVDGHLSTLGLEGKSIAGPLPRWSYRFWERQQAGASQLESYVATQALRLLNRIRMPLEPSAIPEIEFFFSFFPRIPKQVRSHSIPAGLFVHDVIPLRYPELCRPAQIPVFNRILDSLRQEDLIVVNSQCTKIDFCHYLGWSEDSVHVVPLGADPRVFYPELELERLTLVRKKYGLPEGPYYLTLHSFAPHKNMAMLVRAHAQYSADRSDPVPLVIAGGKDVAADTVAAVLGLSSGQLEHVRFIGYVDEEDLAALYTGAKAFFFPSLYEGFGLPVVEAMYCGTPVYAADRASLPELIQDPGCLLDPESMEAWTSAFRIAEEKGPLPSEVVVRVRDRFNWKTTVACLSGLIRNRVR